MKIIHDHEVYDNIVVTLRESYENIDDLSIGIENISELIYSMNLESASPIIEDAIDELEDKLSNKFLDGLDDLIIAMQKSNESILDLDENMKNDMKE